MSSVAKCMGCWLGFLAVSAPVEGSAAGLLKVAGAPEASLCILDHHVNVVINNGFAQTEVIQTFANPGRGASEAVYTFPLPANASLAEMTITTGEKTIQGEVVSRVAAEGLYHEAVTRGEQAGLATKEANRRFEFRVAPLVPGENVIVRFVYYQPLTVDTGVGRYLYPLENGGTDDRAADFWTQHQQVDGRFSLHLVLESAWPLADLRAPGNESAAVLTRVSDSEATCELSQTGAALDRDFVFYYRLADDLPGRVEVIPYRERKDGPGSFMMVVTPGVDLEPVTAGADFIYVLDVSGSMQPKLPTLRTAVARSLKELTSGDRFRIVTFNGESREVTAGWQPVTSETTRRYGELVQKLGASGNTNLYAGFETALVGMDRERPTSLILVTDAVANAGVVSPELIRQLVRRYDVRVFGFLMGNEANWPLMRLVTEVTGGFFAQVSNSDDILGQLTLARSKLGFESMRDVRIDVEGGGVFDLTDVPKKLFRGEQLVVFGRYRSPGSAVLKLNARLSTAEKTYEVPLTFPELDTRNPEIERLWALARIDKLEDAKSTGQLDALTAENAIRALGVTYQLVTDYTSMVVLSDDAFRRAGLERRNQERVQKESEAQTRRAAEPAPSRPVDHDRSRFSLPAPSLRGGGALRSVDVVVMATLLLLGVITSPGRREQA